MKVRISFYSYFKDLTGADQVTEIVASGTTLGGLFSMVAEKFPKLAPMRKSTLWEWITANSPTCCRMGMRSRFFRQFRADEVCHVSDGTGIDHNKEADR